MPRPAKGARLHWRDEFRKKDGSLIHAAGWFIYDGDKRYSTGCARADLAEAEKQLAEYIAKRHRPTRHRHRDPDQVKIADVLNVYGSEVAPNHARPSETASRLAAIAKFFGRLNVADINGQLCRDYVKQASTTSATRRQLEDLRAALKHYYDEGYVTSIPAIVLPEKSVGRQRWLTRSEAARLILAAWRMRQTWKGVASDRRTGQHVARFILVALYTGTRSGAICEAAIRPTEGQGYIAGRRRAKAISPSSAASSTVAPMVSARRRNAGRQCGYPIGCLPISGDGRRRLLASRRRREARARRSAG